MRTKSLRTQPNDPHRSDTKMMEWCEGWSTRPYPHPDFSIREMLGIDPRDELSTEECEAVSIMLERLRK